VDVGIRHGPGAPGFLKTQRTKEACTTVVVLESLRLLFHSSSISEAGLTICFLHGYSRPCFLAPKKGANDCALSQWAAISTRIRFLQGDTHRVLAPSYSYAVGE
jgi:hypothetical protein